MTGRRVYERETIKGTDDAAWHRAEKKLTELRAKVIKQRNTPTSVNLGYAVNNGSAKPTWKTAPATATPATSAASSGRSSATSP